MSRESALRKKVGSWMKSNGWSFYPVETSLEDGISDVLGKRSSDGRIVWIELKLLDGTLFDESLLTVRENQKNFLSTWSSGVNSHSFLLVEFKKSKGFMVLDPKEPNFREFVCTKDWRKIPIKAISCDLGEVLEVTLGSLD